MLIHSWVHPSRKNPFGKVFIEFEDGSIKQYIPSEIGGTFK